ncbi:MAG: ThuA domain-containing protein [Verrucomicrobiota bacterium]
MRPTASPCHGFALWLALLLTTTSIAADESPRAASGVPVLVFSKTAAFRHDSIPVAIAAIRQLGATNGLAITATEDSSQFNDMDLGRFRCVVFCMTTGDVLNPDQQAAFERYIRNGGGYAGIHSSSDTEYDWPWYGRLVGAYFKSHPAIQAASVKLNDFVHPSTVGLPRRWQRTDEWYSFQSNPRGRVHVLATVDEASYSATDEMGFDHPIAWCQEFDGGRSWYTGGGHTAASYSDPLFRQHLVGGILWAAGVAPGDARASLDSSFKKVVLDPNPSEPMQLDITPDGRVLFIERTGALKIWKPDTGSIVVAGQLAVDSGREDGLLGIALDPGFATNQWLYLFYSPAGTEAIQHLARFSMAGDRLDLSSEKVLLTIPVQRETCCHAAGGLSFGPGGLLYISVGDNTNPFESSGFAPIDERPGRSSWDAQRTAANANDLRGKILRIKPEPDGSYSIPEGNLFPPGTPQTQPEIYTMGNRNPFRFSVDRETGWLYWGEVGPDSGVDLPERGPRGHDEWNQARSPGNYGWPYFVADNKPYRDFDFSTQLSGSSFDPTAPVNASPNNTGPSDLPPARPAWIWYPYGGSPEFPQAGVGATRAAMAGPVYHYSNNAGPSSRRLPLYYDKTLFLFEWGRSFCAK